LSTLPQTRPLIYLISDRRALPHNPEIPEPGARQIELIREASRNGCQLVQIREKDLNARDLLELTRAVIAAAHPHGAKVLINDRLDVAIAAKADGVHLPASSFTAAEARALARKKGLNDFLIGVSTHSLAEASSAESGGADFIVCGPVYDTPSKRAYGAPIGIDRFAEICESVKIPVLVLGGINLSNFREPFQRGAAGIAAIRLFADQEKIESSIETILRSWG
jgi:thiamine-phosphate pyrophosphorylase